MPGGKRRYWIATSLFLVLAGCLLFLLIRSGNKSILTHTLPDGTVITIRQVSYGKGYKDTSGNFGQRIAGKILPDKLAHKLGVYTFTFTTSAASTFIIVDGFEPHPISRPASGIPTFLYGAQRPMTAFGSHYLVAASLVMSNGAGDEIWLDPSSGYGLSSNHFVQVFKVPLNSHLDSKLRFRLNYFDYQPGHRTYRSVDFIASNPASRVPPHWTAPALPQTNRVSDLQIVLLELHSYPNPPPPPIGQSTPAMVVQRGVNLWTSARIQILQNGAPSKDWTIASVQVEDEEGNIFRTRSVFKRDFNDPGVLQFEGGLSPRETRKFVFKVTPAIPNHSDPGRDVEFLARPSPVETNASPAR